MYLRESKRRNKDGSTVSYLQLAHNERHPLTGSPVAKVIYNFGRAELVDRQGLARLVSSIARFLEPGDVPGLLPAGDIEVIDSRRLGGAWVLRAVWERLGIAQALVAAGKGRRLDAGLAEQVLFALCANRALEPSSKLAATKWAAQRVALPGVGAFDSEDAYASMDFLLDALEQIAKSIFDRTAHLLNLACDVIFVDTSSTYFETDIPDALDDPVGHQEGCLDGECEPGGAVQGGRRRFSKHSKDHRPDLPQVVLGMAVTGEGIPVRCWTFAGTTSDKAIMKTIKDDLSGWMLNRVIWVADSGFNSQENRAYLQRGATDAFVFGEPLRAANKDVMTALARAGRYHTVAGNLRVKEVRVGQGARAQRFVVCHNPEVATRDARVRDNLVAHAQGLIKDSDAWSTSRRLQLIGRLRDTPGLARLVRQTPTGKLRIDKAAVKREQRFDGKFLLRTSDDTLTTTDIALAYKQLYQVERGWRDLKGALRLRPVYHWREDRIRAHIQICWLALLCIRTIEHQTGDTWRNIRHELDRMHLVTLGTPTGQVTQRSAITPEQNKILAALDIKAPQRILDITLPTA